MSDTNAGYDSDSHDGINTNSEGKFGCNVAHVNKYSGIAEKSMYKFAALISSFRYAGSRASGLRAPLKDVKNTLPVRSAASENFNCTKFTQFTYQNLRGGHSCPNELIYFITLIADLFSDLQNRDSVVRLRRLLECLYKADSQVMLQTALTFLI